MGNRKVHYCSFCGKPDAEVEQLIAGPDVMICNECVAQCAELIDTLKAAHIEYASWHFGDQER